MRHRLILFVATFAAALGLALPVSALADPSYEVMNAPEGVFWRSEPNWAAAERVVGFGVYNGTVIEVHCYQSGTVVEGSADTMWEQATDIGGRGYGSGWVNEHFINDHQPINQPSPGVPPCESTTPPPPVEPPTDGVSSGPGGGSSTPNAFYNRSAAVQWALGHAKDPQARLTMCAWFVSHALWAGGFAKQPGVWTDQGKYGHTASGTANEWLAPNLMRYLRANFTTTYTDITGALKTNAVPGAEPGDLIFYDWEKHRNEGVTHVALVVDIAAGAYPEVAEMGQFDFGALDAAVNLIHHVSSPYIKRGWTWSALHHKWLQKDSPSMKAYLLHIGGGYFTGTF
jgi:Putative amidase domain